MNKTTIDIDFLVKGVEFSDDTQIGNGDEAFRKKYAEINTALVEAVKPLIEPIKWSEHRVYDAAYEADIHCLTDVLMTAIAKYITPVLNTLVPGPSALLLKDAERFYPGSRTPPAPVYLIRSTNASKCIPCGLMCHMADGVVVSFGAPQTEPAPVIWIAVSKNKLRRFKFLVSCTFRLENA
jgi:hypothetical protein